MAEIKTKVNDSSVEDFINSVDNEQRRKDGFVLLDIYERVTGLPAKMWGPTLLGLVCITISPSGARKRVIGR